MTEQPPPGLGGHYGDHQPETVWSPRHYSADLAGQGRWVDLGRPAARPLVRLFTDDHDRLGFLYLDDSDEAATLGDTVGRGLRAAAALGTPTTVVFDHWAETATLALAAGQVRRGALAELVQPNS